MYVREITEPSPELSYNELLGLRPAVIFRSDRETA